MDIQDELKLELLEDLPTYIPLREVVYQTLKKAILNGKLKPGQPLSENLIANQLSVSRTPVREALRSLENENLVSVLSGRKVIVSIPTIQEIEEIYDIRLIVESEALRKITPNDSKTIKQLEACVKMAEVHLKNENLEELHKTNSEFHLTIISALQNNKLKQFLDSLQDTISRYSLYSKTNYTNRFEDDHAQILSYLKQGENEQAVAVLRQHFTTTKNILKAMF